MIQEEPVMLQEELEMLQEGDMTGKRDKMVIVSLGNVEIGPPMSFSSSIHSI